MDPVLSVRPSSKCPNTRYILRKYFIHSSTTCMSLYVQISKMAADGHQRDLHF